MDDARWFLRLRVIEGRLDIVIDTDSSQKSARTALVDADSRTGRQVVAAPPDAVVFQSAAHPIVSYVAEPQTDAAASAEARGEERAEFRHAPVAVMGPMGSRKYPSEAKVSTIASVSPTSNAA